MKNNNWILKKETLGDSGTYETNFLFNDNKFYIMDNHLLAGWCWSQNIDLKTNLGLFHIDRHYDLLYNISNQHVEKNKAYFTGTIQDYMSVKDETTNQYQAVRYDNYIDIFRKLYPNLIKKYYFATHQDGTIPNDIEMYEPEIYDLHENISYWLVNSSLKWIINIDIDYFFHEKNSKFFQILTDDYILGICDEIKKSMNKIQVITIALSPNFCGGWENSFRILKIITDFFNIEFKKIT